MNTFIKKLCPLILSLSMIFSISGCDFNSDDVNNVVNNAFEKYAAMNSTETGTYSKFKDINVQSSYLGYGYDVINSPYMDKNAIDFSSPILDMKKIENATLMMVKENSASVEENTGSSIEELYQSYAASLNVYGKAGKMFSGGLKSDFNGSTNEKTYYKFYKNTYSVKTFNIYMTNTLSELRNMLSEEFQSDLLTLNATALFDKYGTHLIKEAVMGGRMEISSTYSSSTATNSNSVEIAVNAHINYLKNASVNIEASTKYNEDLTQENIESVTKIKQFGGKLVDVHDTEALSNNYASWVESLNTSLEYSALSGIVGDNSLLGLWELLPSDKTQRAQELQNKFVELSGTSYNDLCSKFKLKDFVQSEPEDTSWEPLTYTMDRIVTNDGQRYNPEKPTQDTGHINAHAGFEMGELILYGCRQDGTGFKVVQPNEFSIKYKLLQNPTSLPILNSGVGLVEISNDGESNITGTNIDKAIGNGAYWIRVTYANDTQEEINAVNFMKNKTSGNYIELLSSKNLNNDKTIKTIELVVVYELHHSGPGVFGIWWHSYANHRCSYTFNFQTQ